VTRVSGERIAVGVFVAMAVASLALLTLLAMIWWSVRRVDATDGRPRTDHGRPGGAARRAPSPTGPMRPWRMTGRNPARARQRLVRVPITAEIHDELLQLARRDGVSITDVIADSVVLYRLIRHVGSQRPWPPKHGPSD
jgi:hypothetical protein